MNKLVLASSVVALLAVGSFTANAADKPSLEDNCKAMATKDHVAADKTEAYVKSCVEKHAKTHAAAPAAAPAVAASAAPAAAAPAAAPAKATH